MISAALRTPWPHVVLAALLLAVAWLVWGPTAGLGVILGLVGSAATVAGLWGVIQVLVRHARGEALPPLQMFGVVTLFVMKYPLFYVCVREAYSLGDPGPSGFLAGMTLVYSLAVSWAQASRPA